jgi:hypothetical protein
MTSKTVDDRTPIGKAMEIVERTSFNKEFRERFLADPRATFAQEGIVLPSDIEIVLLMDDPKIFRVVVPAFDDSFEEIGSDHPLAAYIDKPPVG